MTGTGEKGGRNMNDYLELDLRVYEGVEEVYTGERWNPDTDQVPALSEALQDWLLITKDEGNPVYNEDKIRLIDYAEKDGSIEFELGLTDYHSHVAARDLEWIDRMERPNTLGLGAMLETSDGYTILGRKSVENEIGAGEYTAPSGLANASDTGELQDQIYREIEEEINLLEDDIAKLEPSLLLDMMNHYHLFFEGRTEQSFQEVAASWAISDNDEFDRLVGSKSRQTLYADALEDETEIHISGHEPAMRPHTEAAMDITGRR